MIAPSLPSNDFDKYDEPRLHMERLLKARLTDFDLSLRVLLPLEAAGIRTLGDLVKRSRRELMRIHRINRVSVEVLESLLRRLKLR